jgi:hypothetical protein
MNKDLIQCPKDPNLQYQRQICQDLFRKHHLRNWCMTCPLFAVEEPLDKCKATRKSDKNAA